jgi:hypothetical protein
MRNARAGQDRVVESLERLLGELSEWDSYRQLAREVGRLRREQEETRRQTEQLRSDTLTQRPEKLGSTQRAELRRLTERQRELSRSFDRLQSRMREMRARLEDNEPLAAATLRDALDAAQRMTLGSKMRDAGDQLRVNRLGQAAERQSEVVSGLTELQDLLANRRENTLDRVVGELREAAAELSDLEKQQDKVRQDLDDPENHTDQALRELADKERDLAEQLQRLANRLEQLRAGQAGDLLQKAAGALEKASTAAEGGDVADSKQNADLAANRMLQAQQQLQRSLGQTQQDLLREQLVRYRQLLAGVLQGQQNVLKSTQQLDDDRATLANAEKPRWEADAMQLADDELGLQRVVASLVGQVTEVRVLQVVLSDVSDSMGDVERNLRQWRTDRSTQSILRATIAQLEQVMAALDGARDAAGAPQQGTPQQVGSQAQKAFLVAQLKMLRDLQSSINVGTRQLDQLREQGRPLTEIQQQRHRDLANRQGDVARLLAELLKQAGVEATKEEAPDNRLDRLDQILDFD